LTEWDGGKDLQSVEKALSLVNEIVTAKLGL
jgi:hypothetical protein